MNYSINTIEQLKPIIKAFRKLRRLSQKDMANKLGVSQQTYQVLECNPQKVTMDRLFRVLVILGVKIELTDTQQNTSSESGHSKEKGCW